MYDIQYRIVYHIRFIETEFRLGRFGFYDILADSTPNSAKPLGSTPLPLRHNCRHEGYMLL